MVNRILSLIARSDFLFLVYKNERDFCLLTLFLETVLYSLISSRNFWWHFCFSMHRSMSTANSESFTSFPIWSPFISFSFLRDVGRYSKTMLNNSGDYCLIPEFSRNAISFSSLIITLVVCLSYMFCHIFIILHNVPSMSLFRDFLKS